MNYCYVGRISGSKSFVEKIMKVPEYAVDVLGSEISDYDRKLNRNQDQTTAHYIKFVKDKDSYIVRIYDHEVSLYKLMYEVYNDELIQWKDSTNSPRYRERTLSGLARIGKFKFNITYKVLSDMCNINMLFDNGSTTKDIKSCQFSEVTNDKIKVYIINMIEEFTMDVVDSAIKIVDF